MNERITNEIKQHHLGNLNVEFNKFIRKKPDPFTLSSYSTLKSYDTIFGQDNKDAIKGYNVLNFVPTNIDQKSKYKFSIEGDLIVEEVVDNLKNDTFSIYRSTFASEAKPVPTQWHTNFIWDDQTKTFSSLFTNRPYPPLGIPHTWGMV